MHRRHALGSNVIIIDEDDTEYIVIGYSQYTLHSQGRTIVYNSYQIQNVLTGAIYPKYVEEDRLQNVKLVKITKKDLDDMLEQYNDYIILYNEFHDETYKKQADKLIDTMKKYKVE